MEQLASACAARRAAVLERMGAHSLMVLYSGESVPVSMDEGYPFEANHHFFYLTGLRRENMALVLSTSAAEPRTVLFIEEPVPAMERWTGRRVTKEQAQKISGIDDVRYIDSLPGAISRFVTREWVESAWFDCYRDAMGDVDSYNMRKAKMFSAAYPAVTLKNAHPMLATMRMHKDESELAAMQEAIDLTGRALHHVLTHLAPGQMEYQAQAEFEYAIRYGGAEGTAFATIAGSGLNGCMLHYETNRDTCQDGSLLLLDLGTRYENYCSDITRTYPVNGKFTPRQRQVYDIVLKANQEVAAQAKPGMTTLELNNICKKVLAQGCMELGLIENENELGKYYMHGVSHHLGIDVHDVTVDGVKLAPGSVITNEPGLYIDEWAIGVRIEDDLLITEDGCKVLSEAIIKEPDEIEAFMAR